MQLNDDLLFAGFLDASVETSGAFAVRATKPSFQVGTAFSLQTKQQTSIAQQQNGNGSAVKVSLDADGDDAMVDDSDLLEDEDLAAPSQEFDCGPGNGAARKACKNCSCGLAKKQQAEAAKSAVAAARSAAADGAAVKIDLDAIEVPTSSCGNCYLGDAFRCATCPFLGKPAFKKGEEKKVLLDLTDD